MISGEVVKRPISFSGIRIHKATIPAAIARLNNSAAFVTFRMGFV